MKVGKFDIHIQCVDEFMLDYKNECDEFKSKEQEDFESLILGPKKIGSSIMTEELTKDDHVSTITGDHCCVNNEKMCSPGRKSFPVTSIETNKVADKKIINKGAM